jgi:hypothetical protein
VLFKTNIKFGQRITEKTKPRVSERKDAGLIVEVTPQ